MAAVILGWNPNGRTCWDYRAAVEHAAESGRFLHPWVLGGQPPAVSAGTEVWLYVQGSSDAGTGLIGHGAVMSEPYQAVPGEGEPTEWRVSVMFDVLLPVGEQIRPKALRSTVPGIPWAEDIGRPLTRVPLSEEPGLRQLWRDHGPASSHPPGLVPGTYPPGAVSSIDVNRYEGNADARRVCLAFHGTSCAACGFSFEASYGDVGLDLIDVHHVVPPEILGRGYQLDPVADLVPLCPNCHAMAHHGVSPPRTVSELRQIMSVSGHLRGEVVGNSALEAQEDARRILEGGQA